MLWIQCRLRNAGSGRQGGFRFNQDGQRGSERREEVRHQHMWEKSILGNALSWPQQEHFHGASGDPELNGAGLRENRREEGEDNAFKEFCCKGK